MAIIYTPIRLNNTEITNLIAEDGVKWSLNVIDGPNAGRSMSGRMILDYVASKVRLDITCRGLNQTEINSLLGLLGNRVLSVSYKDPMYGLVTKEMYTNNYSGILNMMYNGNVETWGDFTFPLIEV